MQIQSQARKLSLCLKFLGAKDHIHEDLHAYQVRKSDVHHAHMVHTSRDYDLKNQHLEVEALHTQVKTAHHITISQNFRTVHGFELAPCMMSPG